MSPRADLRRGWCPSLSRPMRSGDGLLVRLRLACGVLPPRLARAIAGCAKRFGNGLVDLTRHGNLQLRGVGDASLPELSAELSQVLVPPTEGEPAAGRNIVASPLAGLDPSAVCDIRPIVTALQDEIARDAALRALPAKFSFLVDHGGRFGLDEITADLRFLGMRTPGEPRFVIALGGTAEAAVEIGSCAGAQLPLAATALARAFLSLRGRGQEAPRRMGELVHRMGIESFTRLLGYIAWEPGTSTEASTARAGRLRLAHVIPTGGRARTNRRARPLLPLAGEGASTKSRRMRASVPGGTFPHPSPLRGDTFSREREKEERTIGFHPLREEVGCLAVGAPFGRLFADQLERIAEAAEGSDAELRVTPWRALLIAPIGLDQAKELLPFVASLGLVADPDDPRLAVAACPGAPHCSSATVSTRGEALLLAPLARGFANEGIGLHLSGCRKGCARSDATPITLVGRDGRYDLVLDGRPGDEPWRSGLTVPEAKRLLERGFSKRHGGTVHHDKAGNAG